MKRDMDLIRTIVLAATDLPTDQAMRGLAGVPEAEFAAHVQWMHEAGLVHAALSPKDSLKPATRAMVWRLTWAGCEFADAVRSDTLWNKAKERVMKPSTSFTFDVLKDWLKAEMLQGFPTVRGLGS